MAAINSSIPLHCRALTFTGFRPNAASASAGGGDEHAGGTVGVFHIGRYIIFHFDVVPLAELHMGADLHGHAADPLPQVQLMGALVEQHATTFTGSNVIFNNATSNSYTTFGAYTTTIFTFIVGYFTTIHRKIIVHYI